MVEVPEGVPLSEGATRARQARRLLQRVLEFTPEGVELRTVVRIGRRADEGIVEVAAEEEADLILFGWGGPDRRHHGVADHEEFHPVFSPTIDEVIRERPCDIAVVKQRGVGRVERIVAPVRGGPHAELALRYATALSKAFEAELVVPTVISPGLDPVLRERYQRNLSLFVERHSGDPSAARVVEGDDVTAAILREANSAQLVIMGATASAIDSPGAPLFGQLVEHVAQEAEPTVIVVKTREAPTRATFAERARQDESLEAAEQAASAVRSPARQGRSLVRRVVTRVRRVPRPQAPRGAQGEARADHLGGAAHANEAETIGPIVRAARRELMKVVPLVDELLVIDSDSERRHPTHRRGEGRRVVIHQEVLPSTAPSGKGEALWKSLV